MSASKEKRTRKEQRTAADWVDAKSIREEQERKEQKRNNTIFAVVAVLFVVVGIVSIVWNAGFLQKKSNAATINDVPYTPAQVQFYYRSAYQSFVNNNYSYLSFFGLDVTNSLKAQECYISEEGGTWHDYFVDDALATMLDVQALCDAAKEANFTWNDDLQAEFELQMASLEAGRVDYNETNSKNVTTDEYIKLVMGDMVTKEIFEAETRRSVLAQAYSNSFADSLTYTDDELTSIYNNNKNDYDLVSYNSLRVDGSAATTDADGKTITPTDADKAAAMAAAKTLADDLYSQFKAGKSMEAISGENKNAALTVSEAAKYTDTVLMNWLFDASRKSGDSAVLEDTDNSCYYVVTYSGRHRYDYNTVNIRHILIPLGEGTLTSEDAGYADQQKLLKDMASSEAQSIMTEWKTGAATEESFAELANKYSRDTGSNSNGGLYEQIYKGWAVAAFDEWCFDESRKPGDTGIVYSEDTNGYHIMYYVGEDLPYWKVQVTNTVKNKDYTDWYEALIAKYEIEKNSFGLSAIG